MHPKIGYYQLNQNHVADLRRQAQRDALAHAARTARHKRRHQAAHPRQSLPAAPAATH